MVGGAEAVLESAMSSVVRESAIVFMLGWGVFVCVCVFFSLLLKIIFWFLVVAKRILKFWLPVLFSMVFLWWDRKNRKNKDVS